MPRKSCSKNCLKCELPKCIHDIEDQRRYIQENYDRVRHAEYYKEHKAEIDAKQREYDKKYRKAEQSHEYYLRHKEEINKRNQERYAKNREERLRKAKEHYWSHREEISERRKLKRRGNKVGQQVL